MERVIVTPQGAAKGRAIGTLFLGGFGAMWVWLGLVNAGHADGRSAALVALVVAGFFFAARWLLRAASKLPPAPMQKGVGRVFLIVNVAQWSAAFVSVALLVHFGQVNYAPAAVAAIVGLHFLPLAYVFRAPVQYATGAAMVAAAALLRDDFVAVFFSAGLILWATALFQLASGVRALRWAG